MIIKVKHLIEYLQTNFDPELHLHLDKDGWLEDELNPEDELELIHNRGVFSHYKDEKYEFVTINN